MQHKVKYRTNPNRLAVDGEVSVSKHYYDTNPYHPLWRVRYKTANKAMVHLAVRAGDTSCVYIAHVVIRNGRYHHITTLCAPPNSNLYELLIATATTMDIRGFWMVSMPKLCEIILNPARFLP